MKLHSKGFTIVELLIVIVVIGILAAITIVSYSGISTRAENTKTISGIEKYAKALQIYATNTGAYPITSYPCLGPLGSKCSDISSSPTNTCAGSGSATANATFDTAIKSVLNTMPELSTQSMDCNGNLYSGAFYSSSNGASANINYFLKGDQPCVAPGGSMLSGRYQATNTTRCSLSLPAF